MATQKGISEKAFVRQMAISLGIIILSMLCLAVSSWAMFSEDVQYSNSTLIAANFNVEESIVKIDGNSTLQMSSVSDGTYQLEAGEYEITFTATGTAKEFSGFAQMTVNNDKYYTKQLLPEAEGSSVPSTQKITLTVAEDTYVTVSFKAFWGTCTQSDIMADGANVSVKGIQHGNPVIPSNPQGGDDTQDGDTPTDTNTETE